MVLKKPVDETTVAVMEPVVPVRRLYVGAVVLPEVVNVDVVLTVLDPDFLSALNSACVCLVDILSVYRSWVLVLNERVLLMI